MGKVCVRCFLLAVFCVTFGSPVTAQDRIVTVPKPVPGAPFHVNDSEDLFGKAYRWFAEGEVELAADSLRKLIDISDYELNEDNYYVVVANFTDDMSPIGLFHKGSDFLDTRLYGLEADTLFYVFISTQENAESFVSTLLTRKDSPFTQNLPEFLSLFIELPVPAISTTGGDVWIDVRRYEIPPKFQPNSDISIIVKKDITEEERLGSVILDNTALEHWSFGIATAITSADDVRFIIDDGGIIIEPKPWGDFATFGVINYHFKAVDTKAPTLASSFHLLGGLRLADHIEPILGLGFGFPMGFPVEVHFFAGASLDFANKLKSGFAVGDPITNDEDPFDLDIRVLPRFGIELKFP